MKIADIKKTVELVLAEQFKEAFEFAYTHGVFMSEDWEEIDGIEYYVVAVEDDLFRFEMD